MLRSPPAENDLPSPVTTTTRVSGSLSMSSHTLPSWVCMVSFIALSRSGRLILMSRTPSSGYSKLRFS
jgi:hypothetical protein